MVTSTRGDGLVLWFGVVATLEAVTFLIGAALHAELSIPLGFTELQEPQIIPATIVEGLAGLALALSAWAIFTRKSWAWEVAVGAQAFSLVGVLIGITALTLGEGPRTRLNDVYHAVMVVLLVAGLIVLWSPLGKRTLRGASH